jgi:hypothetical protein
MQTSFWNLMKSLMSLTRASAAIDSCVVGFFFVNATPRTSSKSFLMMKK